MNGDLRRWVPAAYWVAVVSLLASAAWYVVQRSIDVYLQIGIALALVAFIGAIALDPARVRRALRTRQTRYGSNMLLMTAAFVGILVVVNYIVYADPARWDLTEDQQYSLAPETKLILSQLQQPVTIKGFFTPNMAGARDNVRPLLDQYRIESDGLVDYEFIDPLENPIAADQYGVTRDGTLVVVAGESSEVLSFPNERDITSALVRLANPGERKVYFLVGHGERDINENGEAGYSQVSDALQAKSYSVETLNLIAQAEVPQDALAVIIAGPLVPLGQEEVDALDRYLSGGGSLVVLEEPTLATRYGDAEDPLATYLEQRWGLRLNDDLVVDLNSSLPLAGIGMQYASHPITERMGNLTAYFPSARSIEVIPVEGANLSQVGLVRTGDNAWGERDLKGFSEESRLEYDPEQDTQAPLVLAAAAQDQDSGARLVVIGDSDFAANGDYFNLGNGDLFVNSVDWAARQEKLIDLTPKPQTQRFVVPPSIRTLGLIFLSVVILIPGGVVASGVSVWWRRRRRL